MTAAPRCLHFDNIDEWKQVWKCPRYSNTSRLDLSPANGLLYFSDRISRFELSQSSLFVRETFFRAAWETVLCWIKKWSWKGTKNVLINVRKVLIVYERHENIARTSSWCRCFDCVSQLTLLRSWRSLRWVSWIIAHEVKLSVHTMMEFW